MNILNKYNDLFTQEIFDDIDYEKAIEQHLNDLEGTIENENYRNEATEVHNEVFPEATNEEPTEEPNEVPTEVSTEELNKKLIDEPIDIFVKKPEPVIVKQDPLEVIDIIETNIDKKDEDEE